MASLRATVPPLFMKRALRWPVSLLAAMLVSTVHAGDREARQWLERMSEALATRNYEGRFFHLRDSRSEAMRIYHRVDKGKVTERLVSLDGSGREIIRNQTEVICYLPDRRTVLVEKRTDDNTLLAAVPAYNEELETHYNIERGPFTKALGRRTQVINVTPRDQFRYGYRLWLDDETAMPLKSQLCDREGRVIEQILFAELNFRDRIPADSLKPSISGEGFRWIRQDAQPQLAAGQTGNWGVIRPPAGFRLTAWRIQFIAGSSVPVQHLVYSDGLASVSVFIEPRNPQAEPIKGLAKVGAAFAFSRALDDHQVTAVGEVPPVTLEAIAAGVAKEGAKPAPAAPPAPAHQPGPPPPQQ
ncbi:MucB/RseB C-terminal domain-containing protein [Steroidobacter sp. S1-65]|uniref:MucB/RseB C-terminal domain-containing protein n=1 Tax=Steroidobacter gossypii TaxID=2805490 RepID=A0ABS1WVX7_9GAMM|nr:MucB/RseB C-terminal domain-containing protein [Steroidobacter gossypii]MBM0105120.1 MucB/RseB C-terminal domain-containing protein [Steroidobacter gossypii]